MDFYQKDTSENFSLSATSGSFAVSLWGNVTRNPRHKFMDFPETNMSFTLPKPLGLASVAVRMLMMTGTSSLVDYQAQSGNDKKTIVGGLLHFDLVELPDLPKQVDSWVMRTRTV